MTPHWRFAHDVLEALRDHLAPGEVTFRGSHRTGDTDEYSDVDLHARVQCRLDEEFFDSLTACLEQRFGPLKARYDPDYRNDTRAQYLSINLHDYPIFWRLDLLVTSCRENPRKYPDPFPEWSVTTSAFWNLVWAVKYDRRGKPDVAGDYMAAACDKLRTARLEFSYDAVRTLLARLAATGDVDAELISKLRREVPAGP